tara:strand:+ start:2676 stop:3320 length:645 start_codon:yes stop_codon:yes gene_type:complete
MNEVFENDMKFASIFRFYNKYKILILSSIALTVLVLVATLAMTQISKINHEKAASIYSNWLAQDRTAEEGQIRAEELFNELISSYQKTGYAQIALLNKASSDAKAGNTSEALEKFTMLVNISDGFSGNKLFNKLARISCARLLSSNKEYDKALEMLEKYSSSSTNAYIHELIGDILLKKEQSSLAREQYLLAKDKYTDEASKSIISMKIASIKS